MNQPITPPACLFCEGQSRFWHDHPGSDGRSYAIYKCSRCKSAFAFPPPTPEYLDELYRSETNFPGGADTDFEALYRSTVRAVEEQSRSGDSDPQRLARQARELAPGKRLLDVGAGFGYFTRAALDAGFECTAIEPGETSASVFERLNGFRPRPDNFDEAFVARHEGAFDVVLLSQVLEHLPYPARAVENIARVLAPGGVAVIAVPHFGSLFSRVQGKADMFITPPEHVNYFSPEGLTRLFERSGFACDNLYTISRYKREDMRRRLKVKPVADLAFAVLSWIMAAADARGAGMIIDALFVKKPAPPG